ncbi:hypothetical protein C2G38_2137198, partial [Gigaspora rosea]
MMRMIQHIPIETGYSGYYQDPSRLSVPGYISSRRGSDSGIVPDDADNIAQIVCSPNMKHVAVTFKFKPDEKSVVEQQDRRDPKNSVYDENDGKISKVSLFLVNETKELMKESEIMGHKINDPKPKIWAVSDENYIIFKSNNYFHYYNFEIFDAEGKRKDLLFPNPNILANNLAF